MKEGKIIEGWFVEGGKEGKRDEEKKGIKGGNGDSVWKEKGEKKREKEREGG